MASFVSFGTSTLTEVSTEGVSTLTFAFASPPTLIFASALGVSTLVSTLGASALTSCLDPKWNNPIPDPFFSFFSFFSFLSSFLDSSA